MSQRGANFPGVILAYRPIALLPCCLPVLLGFNYMVILYRSTFALFLYRPNAPCPYALFRYCVCFLLPYFLAPQCPVAQLRYFVQ